MAKRLPVFRIAVGLPVAAWLVWLACQLWQPAYQGKTLIVWLDEARQNGDSAAFSPGDQPDSNTAKAIRAIGTDGLPTLVGLIRTKDTALGGKLRALSESHPWIPIHQRETIELQEEGVYGFAVLGPTAMPAVPKLAALLHDDDPHVRTAAAFCLGLIGGGSAGTVPELQNCLGSLLQVKPMNRRGDWDLEAYCALFALREIGPAANSSIPQIRTFTNSVGTITPWAQAALIKLTGQGLDSAIEPLKDTSNLANWRIACMIAQELGSNANPAIPLLLGSLHQTNETIQEDAIAALGRLHSHPEECIPAITPFLHSTNSWIRFHSLQTFSAYGSSAGQWVPTLEIIRCLSDSDDLVRATATNTLRRVAPEAAAKAGIGPGKP